MKTEVYDKQDRLLAVFDGGNVAIARRKGMSKETTDLMVALYVETTGKSEEEARSFLEFEDDDTLCS
jgi:hypothetical protein